MTLVTRNTDELEGLALDWMMGLVEGHELNLYGVGPSIRARVPGLGVHAPWRPSYYWQQGGPLIEKHNLTVERPIEMRGCAVTGFHDWYATHPKNFGGLIRYSGRGKTALVAACRAIVASKLGDTVQVPEELIL